MGSAPGRQQPRHTPTNWTKFRTLAWGQSLVPWNHSHSWNGEDCWSWTTWRQDTGQTSHPCRKDEEDARPLPAPKPLHKQIEKEKSESPSKRTAQRTRRHPYNWISFRIEVGTKLFPTVSFSIFHSVASFRLKLFVSENIFLCQLLKNKSCTFFLSLTAVLHFSVNQGTLGNVGLHWVFGNDVGGS